MVHRLVVPASIVCLILALILFNTRPILSLGISTLGLILVLAEMFTYPKERRDV